MRWRSFTSLIVFRMIGRKKLLVLPISPINAKPQRNSSDCEFAACDSRWLPGNRLRHSVGLRFGKLHRIRLSVMQ